MTSRTICTALLILGISTARVHAQPTQPAPQLPPLDLRDDQSLSSRASVHLRGFRFEGNTIFSDERLARELAPYLDRDLTIEQLEEARLKLTVLYVNAGYINSGAVLPDQEIGDDGIVTIRIVEGRLPREDIRIQSHLKSGVADNVRPKLRLNTKNYLRPRIESAAGRVLNIDRLRDELELLRQNPNIERLNAELKPGASPGQSELDVLIEERQPFHAGVELSNRRPPSIGGQRVELFASHDNLTGFSDSLSIRYTLLQGKLNDLELAGADDFSIAYSRPLNASDTTLQLTFSRTNSLEIEDPFVDLDINSETLEGGVTLRQPLRRTPASELAVFVTGAVRENQTTLLGEPFSFSPGADEGKSQVTVVRFGPEYFTRTVTDAVALRSTFSIGLDLFGATEHGDNVPDGQFFAWLGQAQYVRRLTENDVQLILRASAQITTDRLLSLEQFAIGGFDTVRGYRENQLVRDNGFALTAELHVPIVQTQKWSLQLAPFIDFGGGWDHADPHEHKNISSIGIGVLYDWPKHVSAAVYYGYGFNDFGSTDDLQDIGIHFDLVFTPF